MITVFVRSQSKKVKSPQNSPQKKHSKIKTFRKKFKCETLKVQISHELDKVSIYPNSQLYLRSLGVCPHQLHALYTVLKTNFSVLYNYFLKIKCFQDQNY